MIEEQTLQVIVFVVVRMGGGGAGIA